MLASLEPTSCSDDRPTISAQASDNSYNDSNSGFVAAGFAVGDLVTVTGFTGDTANNIANGVVTAVTAGKLTIGGTDGDVIVDDAAGESVTIKTLGTKIDIGSTVQENTVRLNTGFGLTLGLSSGYRGNVINGNTAGTVAGGVNAGGNICNGSLTCP